MFIPLPLCSLPFQYSHGSRWGCLLSPAIDTWLGSWVRPMKVCKVLVPYHMICFTFLNQVAVPKLKNWPWKKPIHLSVSAQYSEKSILPLQNVSYWFNSHLTHWESYVLGQRLKTHLLHGTHKVGVALLSSPFFPSHFVTRCSARCSLVSRPLESSAVLFSGNPLWRLFMRADDSITWTDLAGGGYGSGTGGRRFSSYRIIGSIAYKLKSISRMD